MDTPLAFELLHHAVALRTLARLLVADHDVDDLCQDVALQTLQAPPPDPTGLRAFLQTVARRVASNHQRAWARRRRREQDVASAAAAAGRGELPSPADVAAQQEQVQRVVAAMLALPEPYRDVLFRRFFHDATPGSLAAQRGVPLATVKSQLQRGLMMLRERLDATERPDWRAVFVAAVGLEHGAKATAATGGVVFALALWFGLALASFGGWAAWSRPWSVPPAPASTAQLAGGATTAARDVPAAIPATREERDADPAARATPAPATRRWLRGRCVDTDGRPLAGVTVELGAHANQEALFHWLHDHAPPPLAPVRLVTAADGAFAFAVEPLPVLDFELAWRHPDFVAMTGCWYTFEDNKDRDLGDVVLPRGVVVTGRLVDRTGAPQIGQLVDLLRREDNEDVWPCERDLGAETRADGTFELPSRLAPGHYEVLLHERRVVTPLTVDLSPAQTVHPIEVVVEPVTAPMAMHGIAVDEQGNGIAGVELYTRGGRIGTTDTTGRFRLSRPPRTADTALLDARCFGYEPLVGLGPFAWGRTDVHLTLHAGVAIDVHVTSAATSAPVADVYVDLDPVGEHSHRRERNRVYGPLANGMATWPRVARGPYKLRVVPRDDGFRTWQREILVDDAAPRRIDVALERTVPPRLVTVQIRFADGHPASGSEIEVLAADEAPASAEPAWRQRDRALTDADGTAQLRLPRAPHLQFAVTGPGHAPLRANVAPDATDHVLTVCRGVRVAGHVVPPDFAARYAARAGTGAHAAPRLRAVPVDARALAANQPPSTPTPMRGDGTFDFGDLAPGEWRIELDWDWPYNGLPFPLTPVAVRHLLVAGEPQPMELDLSPHAACHLRAVVRRNGEPLADTEVDLVYLGFGAPDAEIYATATTDARGLLSCALRPGRVRVGLYEAKRGYLGVSDEVVELRPGATVEAEFTMRAGTLHLRLQRPDGTPARGVRPYFWCAEAVESLRNPISSDEQGCVDVQLAVGTYSIQLGDHGVNGRTIGTVTIAAGQTADVTLTVPADAR